MIAPSLGRNVLPALILAAGLVVGASDGGAVVYTCTKHGDDCDHSFQASTAQELGRTPPNARGEECEGDPAVTVQAALANSKHSSVVNGTTGAEHTDLGIDKFWHRGGQLGLLDNMTCHVTVRVYKNDEWQKTCHVYALEDKAKYVTNCVPN
jgi:hypothetical protein